MQRLARKSRVGCTAGNFYKTRRGKGKNKKVKKCHEVPVDHRFTVRFSGQPFPFTITHHQLAEPRKSECLQIRSCVYFHKMLLGIPMRKFESCWRDSK